MKRQQLLLVLLVILAVAAFYAWMASPRQERISRQVKREQAAGRVAAESRRIGEALRLDLLERETGSGAAVKRDIFNFYVRPAARPAPKPKPAPKPQPVVVRPAPAPKSQPAEAPPTRFRLLGQVRTQKKHKVFLTEEKHLYIVSAGDTFGPAGEYQVESLTDDEIVIRQKGRSVLSRVSLQDKMGGTSQGPGTNGNGNVLSPPAPANRQMRFPMRSFKKYQP